MQHLRLLGIDPGTKESGVADIEFDGSRFHFVWTGRIPNDKVHLRISSAHLVALEAPGGSMFGGGARSANIIRTSYWAGWFACIATERGCRIVEATANEWRKAVVGRANAKNALIAKKVVPLISGWPTRSNNHQRDAAGMAVYAGRLVAAERMVA